MSDFLIKPWSSCIGTQFFFETGAMATVLGQGGPAKVWIL